MLGTRFIKLAIVSASTFVFAANQFPVVHAQTIDLSLNVLYSTASDINSGGIWELVAKTSNFGLAGAEVLVKNISTAADRAPSATVNGTDIAGFNIFVDHTYSTYRSLIFGQAAILPLPGGHEQGAFYGVGQLANGVPDWSGRPVGTNFEGPTFTTLTAPLEIPWGTGDVFGNVAWASAARLASGAFPAGVTPAFVAGSSGNVFTSLGTSTSFGNSVAATVSTIVRTNFITSADYNHNGVVDAADYVLWRNTLNQFVTPGTGADGSNNGVIDQADYDFWRANFGVSGGAGGGASLSTSAVPEPGVASILALGTLGLVSRRRSRGTAVHGV